jgi:molybdopterin synthase sulfur carrier subunit
MAAVTYITVLYFAHLREQLGVNSEVVVLEGQDWTIARLREYLRARGGAYAQALANGKAVRVALNQTMVSETALITDTAEIAFFPPVTGG